MIFVTVGNGKQSFHRLLNAIENLAASRKLDGKDVFIQSGHSTFNSVHCKQQAFLTRQEFEHRIERASIIIAHAGAGTIIEILQAGKVPIVAPRRKAFDEIIDDHQVELAEQLAATGKVIPLWKIEELPAAIEKAGERCNAKLSHGPVKMLSLIAKAIEECQSLTAAKSNLNRSIQ